MAEYSHAELCLGEPLGEPKAHLEMFGKTGTTGADHIDCREIYPAIG